MGVMLYVYLAIALSAAALSGFSTWKVQDWRYGAKENERIEAQREKERNDRRTIDVGATAHERDKTKIRTEFLTITKEVERVVEKPVYRNVCIDDDGLQLIRAAVLGPAPAASQPARAVPRPDAPR